MPYLHDSYRPNLSTIASVYGSVPDTEPTSKGTHIVEYRTLGRTETRVSEIGFGAWAIRIESPGCFSGNSWG